MVYISIDPYKLPCWNEMHVTMGPNGTVQFPKGYDHIWMPIHYGMIVRCH